MYKKVLIAKDVGDINKGVHSLLAELGISDSQYVQYCDDTYFKIKRGELDKEPFELIATDLSLKRTTVPRNIHRERLWSEKQKRGFPNLR